MASAGQMTGRKNREIPKGRKRETKVKQKTNREIPKGRKRETKVKQKTNREIPKGRKREMNIDQELDCGRFSVYAGRFRNFALSSFRDPVFIS
jgi:hypothetical protein